MRYKVKLIMEGMFPSGIEVYTYTVSEDVFNDILSRMENEGIRDYEEDLA